MSSLSVDPRPKSPRVRLYRRADGWLQEIIYPPGPFRLASIDFEMPLEAIYA